MKQHRQIRNTLLPHCREQVDDQFSEQFLDSLCEQTWEELGRYVDHTLRYQLRMSIKYGNRGVQ